MPIAPLHVILSDSDMLEWLECSKELLSAIDKVIDVTPVGSSASTKQNILRFLFMDSRSASYDICVLAESLLNNKRHHFSRAIESSRRLLWENTIDYFYISESENSVAERRMDFLCVVNTKDDNDRKKKEKAFQNKYKDTGHGDFWSGKSREEKTEQGILKYPPIGPNQSFVNLVKPTFSYLNERVHGNTMVGSYFSFDKHGAYKDEYRGQVSLGLLNLLMFYFLFHAYCNFTGRQSEIRGLEFYSSYIRNLLIKDPENTR